MQDIYGNINFPIYSYEELMRLIKQRESDLANALMECDRLQHERNVAWKELELAGLRPKMP